MRVIHVVPAEPVELPEPSPDVVRGELGQFRYLDKPVRSRDRRPGPFWWRVGRPWPRALPCHVQRVWTDPEEDQ